MRREIAELVRTTPGPQKYVTWDDARIRDDGRVEIVHHERERLAKVACLVPFSAALQRDEKAWEAFQARVAEHYVMDAIGSYVVDRLKEAGVTHARVRPWETNRRAVRRCVAASVNGGDEVRLDRSLAITGPWDMGVELFTTGWTRKEVGEPQEYDLRRDLKALRVETRCLAAVYLPQDFRFVHLRTWPARSRAWLVRKLVPARARFWFAVRRADREVAK